MLIQYVARQPQPRRVVSGEVQGATAMVNATLARPTSLAPLGGLPDGREPEEM